MGWVFDEDFAIPKGVIGKNDATRIHARKEHVVVLLIEAFVGINEGEVERAFDLRYDVDGIAYVEVDFVAMRSRLELLADEVFEFVVDFDGMEFAVSRQSFSHAESRIARVGAKLDDATSASHLDKELEYAPL